ncbi:hypothetical protein VNI00_003782 [Paramarasmius palmivorus]|uniref:Cleavage/polyadenylation specificity factor A subunit N-terminal domain-containing protein n=1 Tax=Paramarasmius palmivorus TaxID=297713 RepID=A0AAW0DRJ8_9AGAR
MTINFVKTDVAAECIHLSYPYLFAFKEEGTEIYRIQKACLYHIATISQSLVYFGGVLVDPSRDTVIIEQERLYVFNLHTGRQVKTISLFGSPRTHLISYDHGLVQVTVEGRAGEPPVEEDGILVLDPFGPESAEQEYSIHIRRPRTNNFFVTNHVFFPQGGGAVIVEHSAYSDGPLQLLYWKSEDLQPNNASSSPTRSIDIPMTLPGGDLIEAIHSTPIDGSTFALCKGDIHMGGNARLTTIYAISVPSLDIVWSAESIVGESTSIHYVPTQGVVVVIGEAEENLSYARSWIVALDAQTGALRRFTTFHMQEMGKRLIACQLTTCLSEEGLVTVAENPYIVLFFQDGDVAILSLADFLEKGIPDNDWEALMEWSMYCATHLRVDNWIQRRAGKSIGISNNCVAVLDDEDKIAVLTW